MATDSKTISLDKSREDDAKFYWLADGYAEGGFVKEIDQLLAKKEQEIVQV